MSLPELATRLVRIVAATAIVASLPAASPAAPQQRCYSGSRNYPVIVYDASTRSTFLAMKDDVRDVSVPSSNLIAPNAITPLPKDGFLCDGRPVEIYVINRKLKMSFTVTLTSAVPKPPTTLDLRGLPAPSTAAPPAPGTNPAPKGGFAPTALSPSLLTPDLVIAYLLDDETFDKPFIKVADDISAVQEQFTQFNSNAQQYTQLLKDLTGSAVNPSTQSPMPGASLASLKEEWDTITREVPPANAGNPTPVTETQFDLWTNRADRMGSEVTRVNNAIQAAGALDRLTNLRASAAILLDNLRGIENERDAINRAIEILTSTASRRSEARSPAEERSAYSIEREKADLRNALRQRYQATITDATLARIVDEYVKDGAWLELRARRLVDRERCPGLPFKEPSECKSFNSTPIPSIQDRYCKKLCEVTAENGPEAVVGRLIKDAETAYKNLTDGIKAANRAEAIALQAINALYDFGFAAFQPQPLTLDLQGNSGNLYVFYTISASEQFHRYQIVADISQPQSNCGLANSANTNQNGGINTCTTATPATVVAPQATFAAALFPPASVSVATAPADFRGRVEVHHFTQGALVTGIGYDSIPNVTFAWNPCPTSSTLPGGSTPSPTPSTTPCISPTAPTGGTAPTYYQLVSASQARVAAIEGVNLYFPSRDMFVLSRSDFAPALFLGAAAYPLNHFYIGATEERIRGLSLTGGFTGGAENVLPGNYGYVVGSTAPVNPPIPSASHLKAGWFFMIGFDTGIFIHIFDNSVFQNVLSIGTAGSPTPAPTPSSSPTPAPTSSSQ